MRTSILTPVTRDSRVRYSFSIGIVDKVELVDNMEDGGPCR
jgi:hypothetical protein